MLVEVQTLENTYNYEPKADGYWSQIELKAVDADTPHTFQALMSARNPVDQLHVVKGDILDIHGAIKYSQGLFLVAHAYRAEATGV